MENQEKEPQNNQQRKRRIKKIPVRINSTRNYLQVLNGLAKLTPRELDILAEFVTVQMELAKEGHKEHEGINVFSNEFKRRVAEKLGYSSHESLNNYVRKFMSKGILHKRKLPERRATYTVKPLFIPSDEEQIVFSLQRD